MFDRTKRLKWAALTLGALTALTPAWAADPSGEIVVMGYSGAFQDNYMKAVVEPFMKEHPSIKVTFSPGGNSAQMLGLFRAQKSNPPADVSILDFTVSRIGNAEGLFVKLDPAKLPNLKDVLPEGQMDGFGPGFTFDNLVMIYNPDVVKPPTGVGDLLDPANKGKVVFSPAPNVIGIALQIVVAKSLGQDFKAPIDPSIDALKKVAENVQTWQATPDNYTMIINQAAGLGIGWNARAQLYADRSGGKLKSIVMKEGSILDMDTINLVAGARNPEAANVFINYALSPEPQQRMAELMYYGPTNRNAKLPPELFARTSTAPETLSKMIPVDWAYVASVQDRWSDRWRREVIPVR
jgi:putative spermidine/putrescine transport system substrate-binding protein